MDNLNNIKNFPTIECVSENLELKKIFNKIFGYFDENIFSNTSSIDITKINKDINILHFLNPIFLGIVEIFKTKINSNGEDMIKTLKHLNFSIVNMMSQNNIILNKIIFSEISEFFYLIEKEKLINLNYYPFQKIKNFNIINLIDV